MVLSYRDRVYFSDGGIGVDLLIKKVNDMKLKGNYDITESGKYIVIFEDENGVEWEVEFEIWINKKYIYEETGKQLIDVDMWLNCLSPGFSINEQVDMEIALEEHIENNFNL